MNYYVEASAVKNGNGSRETPFRTIGEAARIARPGDTVIVGPGIYREYVDPANGGTQEHPIVYRSERKGGAHITGAEPVKNWEKLEGNVWMARIPNGVFGEYNPFETLVAGDWYIALKPAHTGDIFLDERSMYEVQDLESVKDPKVSEASWEPEFSLYTWYTEQDKQKNETILYANFQGKDPNQENVEISVRRNCFYPSAEGRGYITLSGVKDGSLRTARSMSQNAAGYLSGNISSRKMTING